MADNNEEHLKDIQDKLSTTINDILLKCYELYGEKEYEKKGRSITIDKNYIGIFDPELKKLIKNLEYYTKMEQELNPFAKLLEMQ